MLRSIVIVDTAIGLLNVAFSFPCHGLPTRGLSQPCWDQNCAMAEAEAGNHY